MSNSSYLTHNTFDQRLGVSSSNMMWSQERWVKNRGFVREGFADLTYLPHDPCGWDATLCAYAYSVRQTLSGRADLNRWAVMNGVAASERYQQLGRDAVVLWHGTSATKATRILRDGFRPVNKGAVYASLNPKVSHAYTRGRSQEKEGGSAMFALVLTQEELEERFHFSQGTQEVRLYARVSPDYMEYILWSDRLQFAGNTKVKHPRPWPRFRFKKQGGEWIPLTQVPVRFDPEQAFSTKQEWLEMSIRRILGELGPATPIELFSSLYSTMEPWEALQHDEIFAALERLCGQPTQKRNMKLFSLSSQND